MSSLLIVVCEKPETIFTLHLYDLLLISSKLCSQLFPFFYPASAHVSHSFLYAFSSCTRFFCSLKRFTERVQHFGHNSTIFYALWSPFETTYGPSANGALTNGFSISTGCSQMRLPQYRPFPSRLVRYSQIRLNRGYFFSDRSRGPPGRRWGTETHYENVRKTTKNVLGVHWHNVVASGPFLFLICTSWVINQQNRLRSCYIYLTKTLQNIKGPEKSICNLKLVSSDTGWKMCSNKS